MLLLAGNSVAQQVRGGGQSMDPDKARVVEYWTSERRASAIPRDLVIDSRGLGYLRRPDGSLQPYGHHIVAENTANSPTPNAKPPGAGGGGSDTTPPTISDDMNPGQGAVIGASHTFSVTVTDASGVKSVSFTIEYPDESTTQTFNANADENGLWTVTLFGFTDGNWSWWVVAKDNAKKQGAHLTFLPYIIRAIIESLKKHPQVASEMGDNEIIIKKYYNIGVAVDTPDGLMVPCIKGADQKSLIDLAKEIDKFVEKAKTRKIDLMDLRGGVFTITNIGVIGTTYFTPIPNFPESCILGTGRIEEMPVVKDGKVVARKIMPISFTYDHRILDGAEAARFMNDLKALLEDPDSLSK